MHELIARLQLYDIKQKLSRMSGKVDCYSSRKPHSNHIGVSAAVDVEFHAFSGDE